MTSIMANIPTITSGAPTTPKNATASTGTTPHVEPHGMAQAIMTVSMRCPHESMTREPDTPPIVHPRHIRNGMRDFPCSPKRAMVWSNT